MLEGVVREVPHAGVFAVADAVLNAGALAVAGLQFGDVIAGVVGQKARVPVAVLIEDLKLRAGVRSFAADDQPGALRPGVEVDQARDLSYPRPVALGATVVDRLLPLAFRDLNNSVTDSLIERIAEREPKARFTTVRGERVAAPAGSARTSISRPRSAAGICPSASPSTWK